MSERRVGRRKTASILKEKQAGGFLMWRVVTSTFFALTFVSSVASAQQPCTTDANRVVSELYRHILERAPDAGAQTWQQQLANGSMTVRQGVRNLVTSQEYMQRFGQPEAGEAVTYERAV